MTNALPPGSLDALAAEVATLETMVERGVSPGELAVVKQRIAMLVKQSDAALTLLNQSRDRISGLIGRLQAAAVEEAPRPQTPLQMRADHLGASTFVEKGWSLISLGDHAGAIQALHRALELAPGDLQAQSLLGWAQMLDQQLDLALATFSRVLAVEPTNALARVNVGYICLKKRIFGEAIEHLSRAIRLGNDRKGLLYAHYYLGLVYLEREMYVDAETFLTKAISLGPNLIEAYYELGRAQWFGGNQDGAKSTWKKGANANKFAPWAARCRELLEAVERGEPVPRSSPSA